VVSDALVVAAFLLADNAGGVELLPLELARGSEAVTAILLERLAGYWHLEALMFEVLVGAATIASGVAVVVMMALAVADWLRRPPEKKEESK
jgi:hypothetical protein